MRTVLFRQLLTECSAWPGGRHNWHRHRLCRRSHDSDPGLFGNTRPGPGLCRDLWHQSAKGLDHRCSCGPAWWTSHVDPTLRRAALRPVHHGDCHHGALGLRRASEPMHALRIESN